MIPSLQQTALQSELFITSAPVIAGICDVVTDPLLAVISGGPIPSVATTHDVANATVPALWRFELSDPSEESRLHKAIDQKIRAATRPAEIDALVQSALRLNLQRRFAIAKEALARIRGLSDEDQSFIVQRFPMEQTLLTQMIWHLAKDHRYFIFEKLCRYFLNTASPRNFIVGMLHLLRALAPAIATEGLKKIVVGIRQRIATVYGDHWMEMESALLGTIATFLPVNDRFEIACGLARQQTQFAPVLLPVFLQLVPSLPKKDRHSVMEVLMRSNNKKVVLAAIRMAAHVMTPLVRELCIENLRAWETDGRIKPDVLGHVIRIREDLQKMRDQERVILDTVLDKYDLPAETPLVVLTAADPQGLQRFRQMEWDASDGEVPANEAPAFVSNRFKKLEMD